MSGRTNFTNSKELGITLLVNKTGICSSSTQFLERVLTSHKTIVISGGCKDHFCYQEDFESNLIHLNNPTHLCSESLMSLSPSKY